MKKIICLGVMGVSLLFATDAMAQERTGRGGRNRSINARQERQQSQIRRGVRSGELTRRETRGLVREQREIREQEREARADGSYTQLERAELQQELNQASRHIRRASNNDRDRNNNNSINERQGNQRDRITQGVGSGELTRGETRRLVGEQREIREQEREARSDGNYTRLERAEIQQELNQSSRHIRRTKNNERDRDQ